MTERIRSTRSEPARDARALLLALALLSFTAGCAGFGGPAGSRSVPFPPTFAALGAAGGLDLADDPRFVVRDRLDLAGPSRSDALAGTSFSHRSQRYHVYPFTTYGSSRIEIRLTPHDPAMAARSAVWILGPRQSDGRFASVRGAAGPNATVEVEASGLAEYVAIVGPAEPGAFLPRYPGVEALLEMDTEDGFEEGTARFDLETREVGAADSETGSEATATSDMILSFAGELDPEFDVLAGRRFRVESPVTDVGRVDALPEDPFGLVFATECADAACGETRGEMLAFAPRAWTRYQLYAPETAASLDDARLAAMNDPQEGFFTVFSATSPHRAEESYLVLDAIGADGQPDFEDPAIVRVVPMVHGDCELDVVEEEECSDPWGSCRMPVCMGRAGPAPDEVPIHAFRATALDFDETSLYDIEARCEGDCSPLAAPTRYPVYLAHGFNSSREVWDDVRSRVVEADPRWEGWLHAESVPPFEPVWRRTEVLRRNLTAYLEDLEARGVRPPEGEEFQRLNVIAHSMGGLDSRYLMGHERYNHPQCHERLECTDAEGAPEACCGTDAEGRAIPWKARLASVTTLSTPHRGSSFAEVGVELLEKKSVDWAFRKAARYILGLSTDEEQQHLRDTLFTLSNSFAEETMTPEFPAPQAERVYSFACATGRESCPTPAGADLPPADGTLPPPNGMATIFGWASEACVTGSCGSIVDPGLALSYGIVKKREGPSDGVVATESAEFGVYMGIRANDHFHWNRLTFAQIVELATRAFGVRREPVDRFYTHWLGTLSRSGY